MHAADRTATRQLASVISESKNKNKIKNNNKNIQTLLGHAESFPDYLLEITKIFNTLLFANRSS
jgi:hypothetical protein